MSIGDFGGDDLGDDGFQSAEPKVLDRRVRPASELQIEAAARAEVSMEPRWAFMAQFYTQDGEFLTRGISTGYSAPLAAQVR